MRQALTMDVLATDLADYLVRKGVGHFTHLPLFKLKTVKLDSVPRNPPHIRARGRSR